MQFIESVEAKYHQQAEEAGVFVVSACGFDSIPQDMGVKFTEDNFPGKYLYYRIDVLITIIVRRVVTVVNLIDKLMVVPKATL